MLSVVVRAGGRPEADSAGGVSGARTYVQAPQQNNNKFGLDSGK